ncbi:MAG: heavy metal-binding domain-containing protein [Myxococcota bacterium]|nr:heavy metal-binding domain-containing protein [Myxococcota bacterium]
MELMIELIVNLGLPLVLLILAYFAGTLLERNHYRSIRVRESRSRRMPVINFRRAPTTWDIRDSGLVTGHVVISVDYFKRFLAGLRAIVGGRVKSYESLLDRARREAILRVKEQAHEAGYDAVVNLRIQTSRLANSRRNGQGLAGVEILAFGTGVKRASIS